MTLAFKNGNIQRSEFYFDMKRTSPGDMITLYSRIDFLIKHLKKWSFGRWKPIIKVEILFEVIRI